MNDPTPGLWKPMVLSAIALILVAAASEYDAGFERLKAMPVGERTRLLESLRDFELKYTPEQQSAVREIDRRLAAMSPDERAHYLAVLRRYHAWFNSLPEQRQDELATRPPGERMALVRTLIRDRPVPVGETPRDLRIIEPGEYSPFEVASAYKIWEALSKEDRAEVERASTEVARRQALFRIGAKPKYAISREVTPDDFDEEKWLRLVRDHWRSLRPIAMLEDAAKNKNAEAAKRWVDVFRPEILRRQAINLYVSRSEFRSVEPERLARFIASQPPWIPSTFDSLSPDEARRRMAFAYRLVFPAGQEIGAAPKPAASPPKGAAKPSPRPRAGTPPKAKPKPAPARENAAPF